MELGILNRPKRGKKEGNYEKNIEECIQEFEEVYKKEAKRKDLREELKFILEILRQSLNVYPEDRPDFKELFFKMMNMVEKDNFEKIREIILVSDKADQGNVKNYEQPAKNDPQKHFPPVLTQFTENYTNGLDLRRNANFAQGNVKNYEQPAKKDPLQQFLLVLTKFTEDYTNGLDLWSNTNFSFISKNWKSDLLMAIKLLPEDADTKTNLENSLFGLAAGIEDIKTHLAFQPSAREVCDICGKKDGKGYFYSVVCNWAKEFVPAFCRICFGMLLRSKFYMEINKPYLTLECFEKESCSKRMIFTEDSLGNFPK